MSTTTNHKRTRIIALMTALLVVAGILGIAPKVGQAATDTQGDLEITKTFVDGATDDEATFQVSLVEGSQVTLPSSYTISGKDGSNPVTKSITGSVVTFNLKNDQMATFADMNPGTLAVAETSAGYTVSGTVKEGDGREKQLQGSSVEVNILAKQKTTVAVTNTKNKEEETTETGKLTVSKEVKGTEDQTLLATEFDFTVKLTQDGKDLNGTFKYTGSKTGTVNNGESISLKDGQSIDIEGIPAGVTYTVTEADKANWTPEKKELTGSIEKDKAVPAAFTNTYIAPTPTGTGDLKISKTVSLPETDKAIKEAEAGSSALERLENRIKQAQGEQFTFTVNLVDADDKALKDEYNYTGTLAGKEVTGKIKDGGTISLAHNDSVTITDLPEGTKYTVTEEKTDNWKVDEASKKGTISSNGASEASFTNTALGALKISKNIKSASGAELSDDLKATDFTFTVTFTQDDVEVEKEFTYTGSKEGTIKSGDSITLKGGESITVIDLPVGMNARVAETPVDNWQASAKALRGEIIEYSARTATFTNTYQDTSSSGSGSSSSSSSTTPRTSGTTTTTRTTTPATADDTNVAVPVVLGALAVGMVVAGRVVRSKE